MTDLIERLRNPNFAMSPTFASSYMREAADEIERLRKGIQDWLDGNYDHPRKHRSEIGTCKHDVPWYSECTICDCAHFTSLLPSHEQGAQ